MKSVNNQQLNLNLKHSQRGDGIVGIVAMITVFVMCLKLGVAIAPAQISDRQLDTAIAQELDKANDNKETKRQLFAAVDRQLGINGTYDVDLKDMYTVKGKPGNFHVVKKYEVESNLFLNVFITNKFEGEIHAAGTNEK